VAVVAELAEVVEGVNDLLGLIHKVAETTSGEPVGWRDFHYRMSEAQRKAIDFAAATVAMRALADLDAEVLERSAHGSVRTMAMAPLLLTLRSSSPCTPGQRWQAFRSQMFSSRSETARDNLSPPFAILPLPSTVTDKTARGRGGMPRLL
jgi:hypothetical protein